MLVATTTTFSSLAVRCLSRYGGGGISIHCLAGAGPTASLSSAIAVACRFSAATAGTARNTDNSSNSSSSNDRPRVDPSRLPSTIPGVTQEELAAKMEAFRDRHAAMVGDAYQRTVAAETEVMRRSMSPEDFETYVAEIEATHAKAAFEAAKVAAMSPMQLHQYKKHMKRKLLLMEYWNWFLYIAVFIGSIFSIFYLFYFFE